MYTPNQIHIIYCKLPGWALFFVVQRFPGHRERSYLTEHGSMEPMYEDKDGVLLRGCMLKWVIAKLPEICCNMDERYICSHTFLTHISILKYRINQMCLWHRRNVWCVFYFWWCELVFTLGHWSLVGHLDDWITWFRRCFFFRLWKAYLFFSSLFRRSQPFELFLSSQVKFCCRISVRNMMCHHPEILPSSEVTFDLKPTLVFWQRTSHPRQMERLQDPRRPRVEVDWPTKRIGWITKLPRPSCLPDTWFNVGSRWCIYFIPLLIEVQDLFQQHQRNI